MLSQIACRDEKQGLELASILIKQGITVKIHLERGWHVIRPLVTLHVEMSAVKAAELLIENFDKDHQEV